MSDKRKYRIFNSIIYTLFLILLTLVVYNVFLIWKQYTKPKTPPRNSINVSPITGLDMDNDVASNFSIVKVAYSEDSLKDLGSLSSASIVYESFNSSCNKKTYSALFSKNDLSLHPSMEIVTYDYNTLPKLSFANSNLESLGFKDCCDSIKITYSKNYETNWKYSNNKYYISTIKDDVLTSKTDSLTGYTNVVINHDTDTYIFTEGKMKKQSYSDSIVLSPGNSFFITLDRNSSIFFE